MATINAQTIITEVMAAHAIAPSLHDFDSVQEFNLLSSKALGLFPGEDASEQAHYLEEAEHLESLSEWLTCKPQPAKMVTFKTSAKGSHRVKNTKEGLSAFASKVRSNAAAFGGGLIRNAKPRPAVTWPASALSLFKQLIEDRDYAAALDLAESKLGAVFYPHGIVVAPVPVDAMPGLMSGMLDTGCYQVYEPVSGLHAGKAATYKKDRSRAAAIDNTERNLSIMDPAKVAAAIAKGQAQPVDHAAARAEWLAAHDLADELRIAEDISRAQADNENHTEASEAAPTVDELAAQDVAHLVASATAAAVIEQASEAVALGEIATTRADTEAAQDLATVDACEAVATCEALATCEASNSAQDSAHSGHHGCAWHGSATGGKAASLQAEFKGAQHGQKISGKSGHWSGFFYTTGAGAPALMFESFGSDAAPVVYLDFETGRERMQALQRLAMDADQRAQDGTTAPAIGLKDTNPEDLDSDRLRAIGAALLESVDVATLGPVTVQRWTAAQYAGALEYLEDINYHTEGLVLQALRLGRDGLAAQARRIIAEHLSTGYLSPALNTERAALAAELAALAGAGDTEPQSQTTHTPASSHEQTTPPPASSCAVGGDAQPAEAAEPGQAEFQRAKPFNFDPRILLDGTGIKPADLVGMGVNYTGNMANPDGRGAVTEVIDTRGESCGCLQLICSLEDGRVVHAQPHYFTSELRPIMQFNGMMHGAPYLAQLAAMVATVRAQASSAKEQATKAHAAELVRLAADYPQLQRAQRYAGGKHAAINMRILLREAFPGQKFSVTSDYNSARVCWTDGPTDADVSAIIGRFDIGASDTQSDYFYTVSTAWSDLFGGVQYMHTSRHESDELITRALVDLYPNEAQRPSVQDWRGHAGVFHWQGNHWTIQAMRDKLASLSAYQAPAPKAKRSAKA